MTILSWNINGLRKKLTDFEFIAYLERFDIFSVIETWENVESDDISNLFPNHFSIFCAAKKVSKFGRAMGGIIVFIKKQYKQFISEINVACTFSIFVTCKKTMFGYDKDLLLAFTYLPPQGSPFYDNKAMNEIALFEDAILKVLSKVSDIHMLFLGDFNCRTGTLADYYNFENNVPVLEEFENVFDHFCSQRISCDTTVSCSGRRLLEFCKDYSVYIVNGRVGQDKNVGNYTYIGPNGCSLIDYILASREVFESILDFCVDSRTESPHLPVWVQLPLKIKRHIERISHLMKSNSCPQAYSRSPRDIQAFIENIKTNFTGSFLSSVMMKKEDLSEDINVIISNIVDKLKCSAIHKTRSNISKTQPVWFDRECESLKNIKLRNLKQFRRIRSEEYLQAYINSRKTFKNIICEKKKIFHEKQLESLISCVADSKSFWSKLKIITCKGNPNRSVNITSQEWFIHFEQLFADVNQEDSEMVENIVIENTDDELENLVFNADISDDEILQAIKHLKKGKSGGPDGLLPEFFMESIDILLPVLNKLFNRLFQSGYFPPCWSQSIIVPLHKKGDINCTDNYRGISLLDVFGKIYVSIINRRVTFYVNVYDKISEAQAGFREGYSTIDNAFILSAILQKYLNRKGGKLYVCFVDFKKAFDSVNRQKLWQVLTTNGIKGNVFKAIYSMYACVKSCVRFNNECTNTFDCPVGLRQGCLLSPVIFSIFVNELSKLIESSDICGIQLFPDITEILLLLFADDIALMADSVRGLQKQINITEKFCDTYKMVVNTVKTKVMVFRRGGRLRKNEKILYKGNELDIVNGFHYVGLLFTPKLSLYRMTDDLSKKGKRILISILSSLHSHGTLSKSVFFKIFDTKICSMLLYGCEVWGIEQFESIERLQYYACKRFMNVTLKASNFGVLGDCGRYPLYITTFKRVIKYWIKILRMPSHRYEKKML